MSLEERYDGLSDELKKEAAACETPEELLEFAKGQGIRLSNEEVEAVSGGYLWDGCSHKWDDCSYHGRHS